MEHTRDAGIRRRGAGARRHAAPLEGEWHPQRMVVLRFKDRSTAQAYYDSETYTRARQVREGAGRIDMILVDGVN